MGKHFPATTTETVEFSCHPVVLTHDLPAKALPAIRIMHAEQWAQQASILAVAKGQPAAQSRRRIS